VQLLSTSISGVLVEQHRAGGLRILAIADERRSDYVPDVPTFTECGVPLVVGGVWFGVVAPAGTPPEAIARLNAAVIRAVEAPDLRERILTGGATPRSTTFEQMGDIMRRDAETWGRAVRSLNVPLN
jgi:tripartite-type tricarboxylate transporter receptor subunit TctC